MNEQKAISFVVPAYNEEKHLARTLTAILSEIDRSGCNAEVIVVNNASTDGTAEVAAAFPDVIVVNEPEKGLVQARRAGFQRANGKLVANVDADTIVTPGWLDRVLEEFRRHPDLVALSGPYIYYDVSKSARAAVRAFYIMGYGFYILNRFVLRVGSMLQGGNFVVDRAALEQIGGYNPLFSFYGEDTDLARRLHAVGGVKFTFQLPALSSGRRLVEEGLWRIGLRYSMNFVWATFMRRPFTDDWIDVRH
ncbi:MAG TPA: glycosyltransferase family 2 protein [Acetobacteraceae bacterium]|nr:glycosyltransferase family 2 protein [Acetobacteraceae bacterium]